MICSENVFSGVFIGHVQQLPHGVAIGVALHTHGPTILSNLTVLEYGFKVILLAINRSHVIDVAAHFLRQTGGALPQFACIQRFVGVFQSGKEFPPGFGVDNTFF